MRRSVKAGPAHSAVGVCVTTLHPPVCLSVSLRGSPLLSSVPPYPFLAVACLVWFLLRFSLSLMLMGLIGSRGRRGREGSVVTPGHHDQVEEAGIHGNSGFRHVCCKMHQCRPWRFCRKNFLPPVLFSSNRSLKMSLNLDTS